MKRIPGRSENIFFSCVLLQSTLLINVNLSHEKILVSLYDFTLKRVAHINCQFRNH